MLNEGLVLTHRPFFIGLIGPQAPYQINLLFSSFAPRQYSSKLGTALGLASVSARQSAQRGDGEGGGRAGERHQGGGAADWRGDHGGGAGERGDCLQRRLAGGRPGDVLLRGADGGCGDGD